MERINVKPLSTNKLYKGRKFKSASYTLFREEMIFSLPDLTVPDGELKLTLHFGVSSKLSDLDNLLKGTIDNLCAKYDFDDRRVYQIICSKEIVKKGEEFISFKFEKYTSL